jgi:hypothetical protein
MQRLLAIVGGGCERLGSTGAAARLLRACLTRTLRLAALDFLEIQVRDLSPYLVGAFSSTHRSEAICPYFYYLLVFDCSAV